MNPNIEHYFLSHIAWECPLSQCEHLIVRQPQYTIYSSFNHYSTRGRINQTLKNLFIKKHAFVKYSMPSKRLFRHISCNN